MDEHKNIVDLAAPGGEADRVAIEFNPGHPGVPEAHYHVVLRHVSKAEQQLIAK